MHNLELGFKGQEIAKRFLQEINYKIICENFRSKRWGEIDIIAFDKNVIVFIEVKTRTSTKYGNPEDSIGIRKLQALRRTANYFCLINNISSQLRLDIISVIILNGKPEIMHFKNAFS